MPLLKLRLKEEQALASPDVCRQAPKDDPRALLSAANFSDLLGVVRTLAELSDYAAVMFHQLHKETLKIGARGEALAARLSALEESTPDAELRVFTATDTSQLLANPGVQWRAKPPSDQNLFTHSELPPYIGEAYMEARPPPPLHVLDRFDRSVENGGALRRYTDPSFFKREWALAELAQAEREKKAKKAKRKAKHEAERRNSHDLQEAAYAKQPSRSRRTPRTAASTTPPQSRAPPLVVSNVPHRYSVYIPQHSSPADSQRFTDPPSDLPTPATHGTISPYAECSFASPPQDRRLGDRELEQDRAGLASASGDLETEGPVVDERGDGLREAESPCVLKREIDKDWPKSILDVRQGSSTTGKRENGVPASLGAELPAVADVRHPDSEPEGAGMGSRAEADDGMYPGEEVREQPIPRARRRTARRIPVTVSGAGRAQKSDGEGETRFPRAESFDSVKQAERVREQLHMEAEPAGGTSETARMNGESGAEGVPIEKDQDAFLGDDAIGSSSPVGKAGRPPPLEIGSRNGDDKDLEGVWETGATTGGVRKADAIVADADRDPGDVTADVSRSLPDENEPQNGRPSEWAATPGGSVAGDYSAPGSPIRSGLQKLQLEYRQAQERLEALLRMQREIEEQALLSVGVADVGLVTNGVNENLATVPSVTSLAVEFSRSSLGGATEDARPESDSPSETVDIDSPAWSTLSSPVHAPIVPRYSESPGLPGRKEWSVLDSPGPRGRHGPETGASIHMSPARETSPGGFSSSPFSSPERSSPLRRPWSLNGPLPDETLSPLTEYQPTRLFTETSLHPNGGPTSTVPAPPPKPLPKPPPLPPPGSLAVSRKPPPPPPPLAPGALTISGPSSSRGGAANLMQAIAQHDKGKLKRVEAREPGDAAPAADRNVMLEQIKRGVNLRRTEPVKAEQKPSRSAVDINVASILERANAIRQAMQDSDDDDEDEDEDDEWSD